MFGRRAEKKIPGFKIERQIAEGGMANVYLAQQESLARPVALKILKKTGNPTFSKRFLSEGRTIASLCHQNVVTIHDIGIVKDQHYISMEYVEGGDLSAAIQRGFKPNEALRIIQQLARCLSFVHKQGVVHRDIKPANILFREGCIPLLTDFGIAKQLNSDTKLTLDGTALGSPQYLSPEQGQGQKVDRRSDIYSLGIVLYEMLAGKPPFKGKTLIKTVMMHVQDPLPPLKRSLMTYMPLLERMTAKKPTDRFRNCDELIKAIDELLNEETASAPVRTTRRKKPAAIQTPAGKPAAKQPNPTESPKIVPTMTMTMDNSVVKQKQPKKRRNYAWLAMIPLALVPASAVYWQALIPSIDIKNPLPMAFDWSKASIQNSDQPVMPAADTPLHPVTASNESENNKKSRNLLSSTSQSVPNHADGSNTTHTHTATKPARKAAPVKRKFSSANTKQQNHFMAVARKRFIENKLTTPKSDNATYYYRKVLRLDPTHQDAQKGLAAIAERYADLTLNASKRKDFNKAHTYLLRGLRIDPTNPRLIAMKSKFKVFNRPSN